MTLSNSRLVTASTLALALSISWAMPSVAMAGPPALPAEQPVAPAPAPAPAPAEGIAVQPQPAPAPAPQPQPAPVYVQPVPAPVYVQPGPPPPAPMPIQPRVNPNRGLGMTIAGFSVFGISYLITAGSATVAIDSGNPEIGRPLLIPVVGPFIAAARLDSATLGFGLGFVGVIQLAGLAMGIGGSVMFAKSRRNARVAAGPGGLQFKF